MKVRRLKTKDLFTVATIIAKCGNDFFITAGRLLIGMNDEEEVENGKKGKKEEKRKTNYGAIGISVFTSLLKYADTDIKEWLASMVEMEVKEFDELPIDAPVEIIEEMARQEDLKDFFTRVMGLRKNIFGGKPT